MSLYRNTVSIRIFVCVIFFINIALLTPAQLMGEACEKLKNFGKFYENSESSGLQSAKLFLSYQHQLGYLDGEDQRGKNFTDDFEEFRRVWMGISGKWGSYWKFKAVSQLSNDRHNYPSSSGGSYRQWGHETFRAANITFDAGKFWDIPSVDSIEIGYGRRTGRMADEWQRSSTMINCLERSSFSNKLWLYDKEKGNPMATWVKWKSGKNTFDAAVFSGTYDDYIGGWSDSKVYYASWLGDFSETSSFEMHENWLSFYKQDGSLNEDQLAGGNDWALSFVNRIGDGPWALHSTVALGNNGEQTNANREGSFGGIVLMPMYWLKEDKIKLVGRYLYQESKQIEGLKLNSRYVPLADTRDSTIDLNSGRGDEHLGFYLGLNYYLCGENLKLISGIQHDNLSSNGTTQYRGWTAGTSFRIWF
ncbi:MAG: porin [Opitutales bacterium]|nr:porin [Opitutales bacterium]